MADADTAAAGLEEHQPSVLASSSENADLETMEGAASTIDRIARRIEDALEREHADAEDPEL